MKNRENIKWLDEQKSKIIYCKCGCDEKIVIKLHHKYYGIPDFVTGHQHIGKRWTNEQKCKVRAIKNSGRFVKGCVAWNKNKPHFSIRGANNPAKRLEVRKKISLSKIGVHRSAECIEKMRQSMLGKKQSIETINKRIKKGENHYNFQGWKSREPYSIEWSYDLKEKIKKRDNYKCQICFKHKNKLFTKTGKKDYLYIHHIDYNKKNSCVNNLVSLCNSCHAKTNFKRSSWVKFFDTMRGEHGNI